MSFLMWHDFYEKVGPTGLRRFSQWFVNARKVNLTAALAKMKELTGKEPQTLFSIDEAMKAMKKLQKK